MKISEGLCNKFLTGLCVLFIAFCFFGMYMGHKQRSEFREICEARGGVPVMPKYQWSCMKPEAFQR